MPKLSIQKFDAFLSKNRIITNSFYVDKYMNCMFIEVYMTGNDEILMIRIPSRYNMKIGHGNNVFPINEIDINDKGTIIDKYTSTNASDKISNVEEIHISDNHNINNIENNMEENYNRPITIKPDDNNKYTDIYRQLKRLSNAVTTIKYKLSIYNSNVLYYIDDENNIRTYEILKSVDNGYKFMKISAIININWIFDKISSLNHDVTEVKKGIINNILRNISNNMSYIIPFNPDTSRKYKEITDKLNEYNSRLTSIKKTTHEIETTERRLIESKISLNDKNRQSQTKMFALNRDIEHTKQIHIIDAKLEDIANTRKELFRNIISLKHKHDNLILKLDNIVFDVAILSVTIKQRVNDMLTI
jgi:hypothetical protein